MRVHTYEFSMDDESADTLIRVLEYAREDPELAAYTRGVIDATVKTIRAQIPIPAPTKIGAVVRTKDSVLGSAWVLVFADPPSWCTPTDPSGHMYRPDQIGRITEVLFEGVDL